MSEGRFVAYYRVSTQGQGRSGLGLEAQQKAVRDYLDGGHWKLIGEFTEIESGKRSDRPMLAEAMRAAKRHKATLVIAKLDRLARSVAFISEIMEGDVEFVAVDMPMANRLTVHILAAVAEHEREMISQRTKSALAAAKARGTPLGNRTNLEVAQRNSRVVRSKASAQFVQNSIPVIKQIRATGLTSLREVAGALNARGVRSARGGEWHPTQVKRVLERANQGTKRKYVRLSPSAWAEICALWEVGDVTLPDLAEQYSVHTRTLQAYFAKHKIIKGSKAAALAIRVKEEIYSNGLGDKDLTIQRARETREKAYKNASAVEEQIMATINAMRKDPSKTLGLTSKLKALALAAAGLERLHDLKFRALGLDKNLPIHDEMPVLIFRDLSDEEIKALHQKDDEDGDEDEAEPFVAESPKLALQDLSDESESAEDDEIVIEGDEQPASEGTAVPTDADGYRLARGSSP